jgi:type 1 glutamine amidotransferase
MRTTSNTIGGRLLAGGLALLALAASRPALADDPAEGKTVLLMAGRPSHGPGEHEHNAGIQLLAKCLQENVPGLKVVTKLNGDWPTPDELEAADTFVIYSDGGGGHPAIQGDRLKELAKETDRGMGLVCLHYAVEFPADKGGPEFKDWLGGYFEANWSVNPHWDADFKQLPEHPITRGVSPFATNDEWYYHMRFRDGMKGVTPILTDLPPDSTLTRPDGPHSGNPAVRKAIADKEPQHVAWAAEREGAGRGFGFTGGHFHKGWGSDDQRKLVLNAILWTAQAEVPEKGVESTLSEGELAKNLDPK